MPNKYEHNGQRVLGGLRRQSIATLTFNVMKTETHKSDFVTRNIKIFDGNRSTAHNTRKGYTATEWRSSNIALEQMTLCCCVEFEAVAE